eukprot:1759171-Amphidinium_carterae.1
MVIGKEDTSTQRGQFRQSLQQPGGAMPAPDVGNGSDSRVHSIITHIDWWLLRLHHIVHFGGLAAAQHKLNNTQETVNSEKHQ